LVAKPSAIGRTTPCTTPNRTAPPQGHRCGTSVSKRRYRGRVPLGRAALEPFAGLAAVKVDTDSFKEHGDLAALRGADNDEDVSYSTLGLRAAATMHWNEMVIVPQVSAAWQHAFNDVTPEASLAFASTGIGFDVTGVPLADNSLLVEAGLDLNLSPTATLGVS
jgi:outer membrane autotransporter protein